MVKNATLRLTNTSTGEPAGPDIKLTNAHVKRYRNILGILYELTPCAKNLLEYLLDRMGSENIVHNNLAARGRFRQDVLNKTENRLLYEDNTVASAFKELTRKDLLMSTARGEYMVNPQFYINSVDINASKRINLLISFYKEKDIELTVQYV